MFILLLLGFPMDGAYVTFLVKIFRSGGHEENGHGKTEEHKYTYISGFVKKLSERKKK